MVPGAQSTGNEGMFIKVPCMAGALVQGQSVCVQGQLSLGRVWEPFHSKHQSQGTGHKPEDLLGD